MFNTRHQAISTPLGLTGGILHQLPDGRQFVTYQTQQMGAEQTNTYRFGLSQEALESPENDPDFLQRFNTSEPT